MSDWLESMGVAVLKANADFRAIFEKFIDTARPQAVFAPPVSAGDYTVITACEVYTALGVGMGSGGGAGPAPAEESDGDLPAADQAATEPEEEEPSPDKGADFGAGAGGGGGGGGVSASRPVAAITIGPDGVTVEPIVDVTKIAIAFFTTFGAMALMFSRMARMSRK